MELLDRIIFEKPEFHARETEVNGYFVPANSFLEEGAAQALSRPGLTCYGISEQVLRFLAVSVAQGDRTLETGAGSSTLVFALRGSFHTVVTPSQDEIQRIREYGFHHGICMDSVVFIAEPSERYLPTLETEDLDIVLLDGKHAFPWPMIDWFFTADRLKVGGLMILDDAEMRRVQPVWLQLSRDRKSLKCREKATAQRGRTPPRACLTAQYSRIRG